MLRAALQGLFPIEYSLDVVELVECVHRREVVDVEMQYLVADLREHGVVELEERHLHSVGRHHILHIRFSRRPHLDRKSVV